MALLTQNWIRFDFVFHGRKGNALGWYFFLKQIINCFHWLILQLRSLSNLMVSHLVIFSFVFLRSFLWTFLRAFLRVVVNFSPNTMNLFWRFPGTFVLFRFVFFFFKKSSKQLKRESSSLPVAFHVSKTRVLKLLIKPNFSPSTMLTLFKEGDSAYKIAEGSQWRFISQCKTSRNWGLYTWVKDGAY